MSSEPDSTPASAVDTVDAVEETVEVTENVQDGAITTTTTTTTVTTTMTTFEEEDAGDTTVQMEQTEVTTQALKEESAIESEVQQVAGVGAVDSQFDAQLASCLAEHTSAADAVDLVPADHVEPILQEIESDKPQDKRKVDTEDFVLLDEDAAWSVQPSGAQTPLDIGNHPEGDASANTSGQEQRQSLVMERVASAGSASIWSESELGSTAGDTDIDSVTVTTAASVAGDDSEEESGQPIQVQDIASPVLKPTCDDSEHIEASAATPSQTSTPVKQPRTVIDAASTSESHTTTASTSTDVTAFPLSTPVHSRVAKDFSNMTPKDSVDDDLSSDSDEAPSDQPERMISDESPPLEALETESPPQSFMLTDDIVQSNDALSIASGNGSGLQAAVPTTETIKHEQASPSTGYTVQPYDLPPNVTAAGVSETEQLSSKPTASEPVDEPQLPELPPSTRTELTVELLDLNNDATTVSEQRSGLSEGVEEVEIEEEADTALVTGNALATAFSAAPHRRRREVATPELYASAASLVQLQKHDAATSSRNSFSASSQLRSQFEAQPKQKRRESTSAVPSSANDFDTVTAILNSESATTRKLVKQLSDGRMPALSTAGSNKLSASTSQSDRNNEKTLTKLLLQPSAIESIKKVVPDPDIELKRMSVALAGEVPDASSRRQVLRTIARALHCSTVSTDDKSAYEKITEIALEAFEETERFGLTVADLTGRSASDKSVRATLRNVDICVYFLSKWVNEQQLDNAAVFAQHISILPIVLRPDSDLYDTQKRISTGLINRNVNNTVLTLGTSSTVVQLVDMLPTYLYISLQSVQERTIKKRIAQRNRAFKWWALFTALLVVVLSAITLLPSDGSAGRDALDAALPSEWATLLYDYSPFSTRNAQRLANFGADNDPHADWIYGQHHQDIGDGMEDAMVEDNDYMAHAEHKDSGRSATKAGYPRNEDNEEKRTEENEEEELPDDMFAWLGSLTRRFANYLRVVERGSVRADQPEGGLVRMLRRTIVSWIDVLFGIDDDYICVDGRCHYIENVALATKKRSIRVRRTHMRIYASNLNGTINWLMDALLDTFDGARIIYARYGAPVHMQLAKTINFIGATPIGEAVHLLRTLLRDSVASLVRIARGLPPLDDPIQPKMYTDPNTAWSTRSWQR